MRIVVFGASGQSGVEVVRAVVARGDTAVAVGRSAARVREKVGDLEGLEVKEGDLLDPEAVSAAVEGADAVIFAAGHVQGSPPDLHQKASQYLVAAMKHHHVRRVVYLGGAGVGAAEDNPTCVDSMFSCILGCVMGAVLRDTGEAAAVLEKSALEWVYVRPGMLGSGEGGKEVVAGYKGQINVGAGIDRKDLATFMVQQVASDEWICKKPCVAKA